MVKRFTKPVRRDWKYECEWADNYCNHISLGNLPHIAKLGELEDLEDIVSDDCMIVFNGKDRTVSLTFGKKKDYEKIVEYLNNLLDIGSV